MHAACDFSSDNNELLKGVLHWIAGHYHTITIGACEKVVIVTHVAPGGEKRIPLLSVQVIDLVIRRE